MIRTGTGLVRQRAPVTYQETAAGRRAVKSRYVPRGDGTVGFRLGVYDRSRELIIDPVLSYSTYLGAADEDFADDIAVDSSGSAYVTGRTASTAFPTTGGAFDTTKNSGVDAFVTKFNPSGSALAYSTFVGGSGEDIGEGIAIDSSGNAYVTGRTNSPSTGAASGQFPIISGAFDASNGGVDGFVLKLDASGSALTYSSYLGGANEDFGEDVVVDASGSAYVTGRTASISTGALANRFPLTVGAPDAAYAGGFEAFASKVNAGGTALTYSTYIGGSGDDFGEGIFVDSSGSAYVTGRTTSNGSGSAAFPTTAGAFDTGHNGGADAFLTKVNATGTSPFTYSTFLGGSSDDQGRDVTVDASGSAYVTGTHLERFPNHGRCLRHVAQRQQRRLRDEVQRHRLVAAHLLDLPGCGQR